MATHATYTSIYLLSFFARGNRRRPSCYDPPASARVFGCHGGNIAFQMSVGGPTIMSLSCMFDPANAPSASRQIKRPRRTLHQDLDTNSGGNAASRVLAPAGGASSPSAYVQRSNRII